MEKIQDLSFNFSLIKPDGIMFADRIIDKYCSFGFRVREFEPLSATEEQIKKHFRIDDEEHTTKMGRILCDNFLHAGLSRERIEEIVKNACPAGSTSDDLYKKAGTVLYEINKKYFLSGCLIPLVIFGEGDVVFSTRMITGATNPIKAEEWTIRGEFSACDMVQANLALQPCCNVIHTSGNPEERDEELKIWLPGFFAK